MAMKLVGYVYRCENCGAEATHPAGAPGGILHGCDFGKGITSFVPARDIGHPTIGTVPEGGR